VLLLSGTLHSVLTSVFLMLEKLPKEPVMAMGRAAGKPREDAVSSTATPAPAAAAMGLCLGQQLHSSDNSRQMVRSSYTTACSHLWKQLAPLQLHTRPCWFGSLPTAVARTEATEQQWQAQQRLHSSAAATAALQLP
jgi:hypothetical protein